METRSELFTFQNSGPSHVFKLIIFTSEKVVNNINLWYCEDKLNEKIAHFRLPSMYQDRRVLKLPNKLWLLERIIMMAQGSAENWIVYLYNNRKEDSSGEEDDDAQSKKLRGQLNSESQATTIIL